VNAIRAIIDISCKDLFCDADDRDAKLACREVVVKPVIYPLKLQLKRVEVGDLQQALSFLGLTIAGEEKKNQRFGATTRAAVRQFQVGHKLPETGEVDEATALAINEELADRGARHRTWIRQRSSGPESAINYKRRRSVTVTRPSHFHALWMLPEAEAIAITRPAIC
jgi:hypothetical protein